MRCDAVTEGTGHPWGGGGHNDIELLAGDELIAAIMRFLRQLV